MVTTISQSDIICFLLKEHGTIGLNVSIGLILSQNILTSCDMLRMFAPTKDQDHISYMYSSSQVS